MKKVLILLSALCISITAQAVEPTKTEIPKVQPTQAQMKSYRENMFEKRLDLTEVQKLKAREIRRKGHEKLNPVIEQIKTKKQEAEMVRRSRMAVQMQEEKLTAIDNELKVLEKQAQAIRKENMKEFESILTWQQKRTLKQMKKEGRQNYKMNHCPPKPSMERPQTLKQVK